MNTPWTDKVEYHSPPWHPMREGTVDVDFARRLEALVHMQHEVLRKLILNHSVAMMLNPESMLFSGQAMNEYEQLKREILSDLPI